MSARRSLEGLISGPEAKRPAVLQNVCNGARGVNSAGFAVKTKPLKPVPPPMRPLNPKTVATNMSEKMRNGVSPSGDEATTTRCVSVGNGEPALKTTDRVLVHSETQTPSFPGCKHEVISDVVSSRAKEIFALLSKSLTERMANLEAENRNLKLRLSQANDRLTRIKEATAGKLTDKPKLINVQQTSFGLGKQLSSQEDVVVETELVEIRKPQKTGVVASGSTQHHSSAAVSHTTPTGQSSLCTAAGMVSSGGALLHAPLASVATQGAHALTPAWAGSEQSKAVWEKRRLSSSSGPKLLMSPVSSQHQNHLELTDQRAKALGHFVAPPSLPPPVPPPPYTQPVQPADPKTRPSSLDTTAKVNVNQTRQFSQVDLTTTQLDVHTPTSSHKQRTGTSKQVDHKWNQSPHYDHCSHLFPQGDILDPTGTPSHSTNYNHRTTHVDAANSVHVELTRTSELASVQTVVPTQHMSQPLTRQITQQLYSQNYYAPATRNPQYDHQSHSHYRQVSQPVYPAHTASYGAEARNTTSIPNRSTVVNVPTVPSNPSNIQYGSQRSYNQYNTMSTTNTGNVQPLSRLPTPTVTSQVIPSGIVLQWTVCDEDTHKVQAIDQYEIYAYQGNSPHTPVGHQPDPGWNKVGTVKALPLPMQCTLTQFTKGRTYYFVIRAIDASGHFGSFSRRCTVNLP